MPCLPSNLIHQSTRLSAACTTAMKAETEPCSMQLWVAAALGLSLQEAESQCDTLVLSGHVAERNGYAGTFPAKGCQQPMQSTPAGVGCGLPLQLSRCLPVSVRRYLAILSSRAEDRCWVEALKYLTRIFSPLQPRLHVGPINLLQDLHLLRGIGFFSGSG